jgi:hypothetical protein
MTAIETSATPMTTIAGVAIDGAEAAIGLLLLWRSAKKLRRFPAPAGNGLGSAWSGQYPSPTT